MRPSLNFCLGPSPCAQTLAITGQMRELGAMKYAQIAAIALLAFSLPALAYIPEFGLIVSHAAEQHGKGLYLVDQEVTYRRDAEAYTVKETWIVSDEGNLRVTLEGRGALKG